MKGRIKADPINVNKFEFRVGGVITLYPTEVTGLEQENPGVDLPDNTTAAGGRPKPSECVVKIPAHHKDEILFMNQWYSEGIGKQAPTYKRPAIYRMNSGSETNFLLANLEGVWITKVKLPDGEMKNDGDMAVVEYTCKLDNIEFI